MRKRLPEFTGEDRERGYWATHDSTAYLDWKKPKRIVLPNLKPSLTHLLHHTGGSRPFSIGCSFENGLVTRFLST
jgi:hypothetical protein